LGLRALIEWELVVPRRHGPPDRQRGAALQRRRGRPPLPLRGRSRDDGPIVKWEWDWDGDGPSTPRWTSRGSMCSWTSREGGTSRCASRTRRDRQTPTRPLWMSTHVPPDVTIVGPANVAASDTPYPYEVAIEPVLRHIYSCEWFVDDAAPVRGAEVWLFFREIGTHELALRVTDELGRPLNGQLTVTAHWTGPAEIRIIAPSEVFVGETYQVRGRPGLPERIGQVDVLLVQGRRAGGRGEVPRARRGARALGDGRGAVHRQRRQQRLGRGRHRRARAPNAAHPVAGGRHHHEHRPRGMDRHGAAGDVRRVHRAHLDGAALQGGLADLGG